VIRDIAAWQFNPLKLVDFVAVREAVPGPSRHFAAMQQSVAFGGKADID
jgi:hypothetical protein